MVIPTKEPELDQDVEEISDPCQLILRGNRSLSIGDPEDAVNALSRACSLLSGQYGELSPECADAYYCYGKALLELYRLESDPVKKDAFNDTNNLIPVGHRLNFTDDDDAEATEAEGTRSDAVEGSSKDNNNDNDDLNDDKAATVPDLVDKIDSASDSTVVASSSQMETNEENLEDNDLQLAWEMLELAKKVYELRESSDERNDLLAQTYIALGDVSMENESFQLAIDDIKKGIELMKQKSNSDVMKDRDIAEGYFKLGTAYALTFEKKLAIEAFEVSKTYLNNRLNKIDNSEEIKEIKESLLTEIDAKIEETKVLQKEEIERVSKLLKGTVNVGGECSSTTQIAADKNHNVTSSSGASDITYLVKRKRKSVSEDEISSTEISVKQAKLSE